MNVVEVEKNFAMLVNKVYLEGISVDLEQDDKVIARLTPAEPPSPLTVGELNAFLRSLPSLGDDADAFAEDVRAIRAGFPAETRSRPHPWLPYAGMFKDDPDFQEVSPFLLARNA